jgi:phosphatidylethanolamine/phosphatidyl-N-methylethanolamine N-methyltransferase
MSINDDYYDEYYSKVLNQGLIGRVSSISHSSLERRIDVKSHFSTVLELGAGEGQHFQFVKHSFDVYLQSDIRIDNLNNKSKAADVRISNVEADACNLERFDSNSIDRIIATCLLAHLHDLMKSVNEWRRVVRNNGKISIYVPCEPGVFLRVARVVSTARKARKYIDRPILRHYVEHCNYYLGMDAAIQMAFKDDKIESKKYPFNFLSWDFNLWKIYTITISKDVSQTSEQDN